VKTTTVRVVDEGPAVDCQFDFADMALLIEPGSGAGFGFTGVRRSGRTQFTDRQDSCVLEVPQPYDLPVFIRVKVQRDFHVEGADACHRCESTCDGSQ
jgi:hypothetical protein